MLTGLIRITGGYKMAEKTSSHGFFRFIMILNLIADVYMCITSGIKSGEPAVLIGMIMLSLCFFALMIFMMLLRLNMKRSSCAILGGGYLLMNAAIGAIFACELYIRPEAEILKRIETAGVIFIIVLILITVNVIVRRKVENRL